MGSSGIAWIDAAFNFGVTALVVGAQWLGVTYEEINVWLFMVVWPAHIVLTVWMGWKLFRCERSLS